MNLAMGTVSVLSVLVTVGALGLSIFVMILTIQCLLLAKKALTKYLNN